MDFEPAPDGLPADDLLRRYEELQLRVTRFSAVEMQLVAARQRLDRQVGIHTRMQEFNARALQRMDDVAFNRLTAESLVDSFEVEMGVFIPDLRTSLPSTWGLHGLGPSEAEQLVEQFNLGGGDGTKGGAQLLTRERLAYVGLGSRLREALLFAPPSGADGPLLVLIAANSVAGAEFYEVLQPEHAQAFTVFAQQVRAHLDNRRTRDSLRLSEENLSITLNSIGEGVIATDVAGRVRRMNPIAERLCGWRIEEAAGRQLREVWRVVDGGDRAARNFASPIPAGRVELPPDSVLLERGGGEHVLSASVAPILGAGGAASGLVAVFRDVTEQRRAEAERRRLEEELQRSQKLETLGTLAGGIAHDFNNVLAGVLGCVETAISALPEGHEARKPLELSSAGIFRARDVVRRLLLFARRMPAGILVPLDLKRVVADALPLLRAALPSSAKLEVEPAADGMTVRGDETQLQQVLTNLCVNAAQAMEGRPGRIVIGLERSSGARPGESGAAEPHACLSVQDNGCGMSAETVARIFDPFFTTKGQTGGTGLGLSVVQGIVETHGGFCRVRSEPGRGTTMEVHLPLLNAPAEVQATQSEIARAAPAAIGGGRGVLVVDDDETVRMIATGSLQRMGFAVQAFADGHEAEAALAARPTGFTLALIDLSMPGMTGNVLAERLHGARPDLPIVIMSGDHGQFPDIRTASPHLLHRLAKPFSFRELSATVSTVLGPGPAR
ncbi:MAG: hypothetical protein RLZZ188_161 [Verrucomicrobiota bacterium]